MRLPIAAVFGAANHVLSLGIHAENDLFFRCPDLAGKMFALHARTGGNATLLKPPPRVRTATAISTPIRLSKSWRPQVLAFLRAILPAK